MKKLLLLLLFVSFAAQGQEGGFYWVGENEALINSVRYTQVGSFFDDFATLQVHERVLGGGIARFERRNGAWVMTSYDGMDTPARCRISFFIFINEHGYYDYWTPNRYNRFNPELNAGGGTYEEYLTQFYQAMDNASFSCATSGS